MGVGEVHAFVGQAIQHRRRYLGVGIVAGQITVAEIVGQDDDDVGRLLRS